MEPVAPVTTEPTHLNAESETKELVAPVSTDLTDPQLEPETEEPVAPVPLTHPIPLLHFHAYPEHLNTDPDDSAR